MFRGRRSEYKFLLTLLIFSVNIGRSTQFPSQLAVVTAHQHGTLGLRPRLSHQWLANRATTEAIAPTSGVLELIRGWINDGLVMASVRWLSPFLGFAQLRRTDRLVQRFDNSSEPFGEKSRLSRQGTPLTGRLASTFEIVGLRSPRGRMRVHESDRRRSTQFCIVGRAKNRN